MHIKINKYQLFFLAILVCGIFMLLVGCSVNDKSALSNQLAYKEDLIEKDKLKVAIVPDLKPYEYIENDCVVGFDIDVINLIAKELDLKVDLNITSMNNIIDEVENGKLYDVGISALKITDERQKKVLMSVPYYLVSKDGEQNNLGIAVCKDKIALSRAINKVIEIEKSNGCLQEITRK